MLFPDDIFSHIISFLTPDPIVEQQKKYKLLMEADLLDLFSFSEYMDDVDVLYGYWSYYYDTGGNLGNYPYPTGLITPL